MDALLTKPVRKYLYGVTIALVAVLVAMNVIHPDSAPVWLAFAAAVFGLAAPLTAITHMTPDPEEYATAEELDIEGPA
jgi:hypothetical protein